MDQKDALIRAIVDRLNGMSCQRLRLALIAVSRMSRAKEKSA